jgi:hypothetical protein
VRVRRPEKAERGGDGVRAVTRVVQPRRQLRVPRDERDDRCGHGSRERDARRAGPRDGSRRRRRDARLADPFEDALVDRLGNGLRGRDERQVGRDLAEVVEQFAAARAAGEVLEQPTLDLRAAVVVQRAERVRGDRFL